MDTRIAKEVEEVDVVVGGHTNTFFYTGLLFDSFSTAEKLMYYRKLSLILIRKSLFGSEAFGVLKVGLLQKSVVPFNLKY